MDDFKESLLGLLEDKLNAANFSKEDLSDKDDLIELGILDSVGFLEFMATVENTFNKSFDFSELDPSEFTSIEGLVNQLKKE